MRIHTVRIAASSAALVLALAACGAGAPARGAGTPPVAGPASAGAQVYQPLRVGDYWKYSCNRQFGITNRVVGSRLLGTRRVYEFAVQIPSSPTASVVQTQLLANDAAGNTRIYGYLVAGKVVRVPAATIVSAVPIDGRHYDYTSPEGTPVSRVFVGFENTNPTPLGVFRVAPYFESNSTHNYGYALGNGIMEEDHGPNYRYDCLIQSFRA